MKKAKMPHYWQTIKKMWYLYAMEFYSCIKKNNILSLAGKWMELENPILNEINQIQKAKYHVFSYMCNIDLI
jgi:hypothetical protein